MNRQYWLKRMLLAIAMLGLAATGTALLSAKPPPPKPHPKAHKPHPKVRKAVRHRHKKLRRIPRHRRVRVRKVGATVVVQQGETVIRRGPAITIKSADALQTVPARNLSETATYKVVRVAKDCGSVVLMRDEKETSVRLLGVVPIQTSNAAESSDKTTSRFVRNLLIGEFVSLDYDSTLAQEDESGQAVAYLYRAPDGMLLNLEIVRQGYGLTPDYYSFQHDKLFRFYQQKAQADGKGIWASVKAETKTEASEPAETEVAPLSSTAGS